MHIVTTAAEVRSRVRAWRLGGARVSFVPTMGNLHAGHASLLAVARARADKVVASVFVNPLQFGPGDDFAAYPRTPDEDSRLLHEAHCEVLFVPSIQEIYPDGGAQLTMISVRGLSGILCGQFRPGHFDGVATVVAKLFNIVMPDVAVFGEKDFQQFMIVRRMISDLLLPVEVVAAPTVRAADGLALSSRNVYLNQAERALAPIVYQSLQQAATRLQAGDRDFLGLEGAGWRALAAAGLRPDYFAIRDTQDLNAPRPGTREFVVLTAARLGKARLIDNLRVAATR